MTMFWEKKTGKRGFLTVWPSDLDFSEQKKTFLKFYFRSLNVDPQNIFFYFWNFKYILGDEKLIVSKLKTI